jgi:lipopolysaccharide transport system permease protein
MKKEETWDIVITSKSNWFDFRINEVFNYSDLLFLFVKRDLITFYKQTILGPLWFFLQPLITTFVFSFVFSSVAQISTDGVPPIIFYMSGIIAWNYFSQCLSSTSTVFTSNVGLFSKVYFPRIIIPISKTISSLTKFGVQLLMFLSIYVYFLLNGNTVLKPNINHLLILPILVFQMAILGQGIGMIVSSLTIKYRDLQHLVSFGTQLLMYASPIVYPLSSVPKEYQFYIKLNPMTPIINIFRQAFIGVGTIDFPLFYQSIFFSIFIFLVGLVLFNKFEKNFVDTA